MRSPISSISCALYVAIGRPAAHATHAINRSPQAADRSERR